jgi:aminomethyltransferase
LLKQTPLNASHRAAGARMVDFGGWDMPVHYGSQIDEHHAVRNDAGMFDVSHMQIVDLEGEGARDFLRYALANNVDKLREPGKALYSCLLTPEGTVIDDLIVYFLREDFFRIVVNAGTAEKDIDWLRRLLAERAPRLSLTPRTDLAMIAVQGPRREPRSGARFPAPRRRAHRSSRSRPLASPPNGARPSSRAPDTPAKMASRSRSQRRVPSDCGACSLPPAFVPRASARATRCASKPG